MRRRNPDVKIVNGYEIKPRAQLWRADLRGADLRDADLRDADLGGAHLEGAHLEGAHLEGAKLGYAHLEGAHLEGAHLEGAYLDRAYLDGAHLEGADLTGAKLQYAWLPNAHLKGAHLEGARLNNTQLVGADFTDADLKNAEFNGIPKRYTVNTNFTNADFSYATLTDSKFSESILTDAIFLGAKINERTILQLTDNVRKHLPKYLSASNLENADLQNADLSGVYLVEANLEEANLEGANLEGAFLNYAHLNGANLKSAKLNSANLQKAILIRAHLEEAQLNNANLFFADLIDAHLEGAHLEGAYLNRANLEGAHLEGAILERAFLQHAHLEGADFTDADLSYANIEDTDLSKSILTNTVFIGAIFNTRTKFPAKFSRKRLLPIVYDRRSYGEMTGSVLKLGKPDSPPRAADFKRKYPNEFERLIRDTGGKDFTDSVKVAIRSKYQTPFDWYVTRGFYENDAQRLSKNANDVITLNIDLKKLVATEKQIELIKKLAKISRQSGHPHNKLPLFTIGWVRFDVDEAHKLYLVEEVQSDVWVVRQQTKNVDAQTQRQLRRARILPEDFDEVFEVLRPYAERFYEDALGILFMEAEEKGYSVEMLGFADKKYYGSPRSIYTDLPRKMGMRPQPTQTDLELRDKVSYYKPNPSRPRRRY